MNFNGNKLKISLGNFKSLALGWVFQWRAVREPGWDPSLATATWDTGAGLSFMLPTVWHKTCSGSQGLGGEGDTQRGTWRHLLATCHGCWVEMTSAGEPGRASLLCDSPPEPQNVASFGEMSLQIELGTSTWDHPRLSDGPKSSESVVIRDTGKRTKRGVGTWRWRKRLAKSLHLCQSTVLALKNGIKPSPGW